MLLTWRPDALLHVFRSSIVREVVHASGKLDVGFGPARGDRRVATQPEFVYRRISRSAMRCCEGGCTMNYNTISAQRIAGALGAEIAGVDLSRPLSDEVIGEIRQALLDHQVIFFHDQHLTAEQHLAFGRRFGGLQIHDFVEPRRRISTFSRSARSLTRHAISAAAGTPMHPWMYGQVIVE